MSHTVPIVSVVDDDVSLRESLGIVDLLRRQGAPDVCVRTGIPCLPANPGSQLLCAGRMLGIHTYNSRACALARASEVSEAIEHLYEALLRSIHRAGADAH